MHTEDKSQPPSLLILYGTQTGNAERLAHVLEKKCKALNINAAAENMISFKTDDFGKTANLAVIVSTHGIGDPPVEASDLYTFLCQAKTPLLSGVRYTVLSLGDSGYSQFCQAGKDFDNVLERLGARRFLPRQDCDVDFEENALSWMQSVLDTMQRRSISM